MHINDIIVAISVSVTILLGQSASGYSENKERPYSWTDLCPVGVLSCSAESNGLDTCCAPRYGLVVLVQQWYKGMGLSDEYTLHGLWPDTCSGDHTSDNGCDESRSYTNISLIVQSVDPSLYNELGTHWPSYKGDNNWFWSHEWTKHGTCVTTMDPSCYGPYKKYQDVVDYFNTALNLHTKYNYYNALKTHGIVPAVGKKFTASEFKAAIKAELGMDTTIKCSSGTLSEIWTWFNVKDRTQYIPTNTYANDTCNYFEYPPK